MIYQQDLECLLQIPSSLMIRAKELWEENPYDFCIQYATETSIVFGATNRVVWTIDNGFRIELGACTDKFILHFKEKMKR